MLFKFVYNFRGNLWIGAASYVYACIRNAGDSVDWHYAQIYTKQAARMFSQQTGVADAMLVWHSTAATLANNLVPPSVVTATGCALSDYTGYTNTPALLKCTRGGVNSGINVYVSHANTSGVSACDSTQSAPCWIDLPSGYQLGAYPFYSIAFSVTTTTTQYYVLTYVPPPATSGQDLAGLDLLCLPGVASGAPTTCPVSQKQMTITFAELNRQLRKSLNASPMYYGAVNSSHVLVTPTILFAGTATNTALSYTVPNAVPIGSIGIITQVTLCSTSASC